MASLNPLSWTEWAIFLSLLGAYWSAATPSLKVSRQRALGIATAVLFCNLLAWLGLVWGQTPLEFKITAVLMPRLFQIDSLNAPILALVALLHWVLIMMTLKTRRNRFSFSRTLLLEACMLVTLSSYQPWVLILLQSLVILPLRDELHQRGHSARVLSLHWGSASLCLLLGWGLSTIYPWQALGYGLLALGISIQAGLLPAHCWVIDIFDKASLGTALIFLAPLSVLYSASRLLASAPTQVLYFLAGLALLSAFYTAAMASQAKESRGFLCAFIQSQTHLALAGLLLPNLLGLTASLFIWCASPLALMGIGLSIRSLEARSGRLNLQQFHGFHSQTPTLSAIFLMCGLAAIGFPGTLGFFGLEMLTDATIQASRFWGFLVISTSALNGIAMFRVYNQLFLGKEHSSEVDLKIRTMELAGFLILVSLLIGGSFWPQPGLDTRKQAAEELFSKQEYKAQHVLLGKKASTYSGHVSWVPKLD